MSSPYWTETSTIEAYNKEYKNPFLAVKMIAKDARQLAESHGNIISHSEALSWVITGEKPEAISQYHIYSVRNKKLNEFLESALSYVNDVEVAQAVRESFYESFNNHHLIYTYKNIVDESRRARVRILSKMIWHKFNSDT